VATPPMVSEPYRAPAPSEQLAAAASALTSWTEIAEQEECRQAALATTHDSSPPQGGGYWIS